MAALRNYPIDLERFTRFFESTRTREALFHMGGRVLSRVDIIALGNRLKIYTVVVDANGKINDSMYDFWYQYVYCTSDNYKLDYDHHTQDFDRWCDRIILKYVHWKFEVLNIDKDLLDVAVI